MSSWNIKLWNGLARCSICSLYFLWFRRDSLHVASKSSSTIRHNIEIFHVMLSNLMFSWSVWCSAKLFDVTLHHLCVRCTIQHYAEPFHVTLLVSAQAVPFDITLSHFTQRYTVSMCAVLIDIALSHFTQRYTVCVYSVPFDITLSHLAQRYTVRVLYYKWVLFAIDLMWLSGVILS